MSKDDKPSRGRPTKYHDGMPDLLRKFFDVELYKTYTEEVASQGRAVAVVKSKACNFPTFEGFCWEYGLHHSTLLLWCTKHPNFSEAYKECKERQKTILITHALNGDYNSGFAKFLAVNVTDLKDSTHQQVEQTTVQINIDAEDNEL